jgi:hypothetical protein
MRRTMAAGAQVQNATIAQCLAARPRRHVLRCRVDLVFRDAMEFVRFYAKRKHVLVAYPRGRRRCVLAEERERCKISTNHINSARRAFAARRSLVENPSVNRP